MRGAKLTVGESDAIVCGMDWRGTDWGAVLALGKVSW